jgi:hypothetical protein
MSVFRSLGMEITALKWEPGGGCIMKRDHGDRIRLDLIDYN